MASRLRQNVQKAGCKPADTRQASGAVGAASRSPRTPEKAPEACHAGSDGMAGRVKSRVAYEDRPEDGSGGRVVPMRLQKFLARAGVASRRGSENLMTAGRVAVNGVVVTELGSKVDPLVDSVTVDGKAVRLSDTPVTLMLNKPAGVITTMKAQSDKPIVATLIPADEYPGLFPIGRLDADTTGLLLFSTDGELGNLLLHPRHHVSKTYLARLKAPLEKSAAERLRAGVVLDDGPAQPADVSYADKARKLVRITIHEGRYHQVKRMFEAVGNAVVSLHRESFGPLRLGALKPGEWRLLTDREVEVLVASGTGAGEEAALEAKGKTIVATETGNRTIFG